MCLSVDAPATREVGSGAVGKGFMGDLGGVPGLLVLVSILYLSVVDLAGTWRMVRHLVSS